MHKRILAFLLFLFYSLGISYGRNFCYTLKIDYYGKKIAKIKLKGLDTVLINCTVYNCGDEKLKIDTMHTFSAVPGDDYFYFSFYKNGKRYTDDRAADIDYVESPLIDHGRYLRKGESFTYKIYPFRLYGPDKIGVYDMIWHINLSNDSLENQQSNKIKVIIE